MKLSLLVKGSSKKLAHAARLKKGREVYTSPRDRSGRPQAAAAADLVEVSLVQKIPGNSDQPKSRKCPLPSLGIFISMVCSPSCRSPTPFQGPLYPRFLQQAASFPGQYVINPGIAAWNRDPDLLFRPPFYLALFLTIQLPPFKSSPSYCPYLRQSTSLHSYIFFSLLIQSYTYTFACKYRKTI